MSELEPSWQGIADAIDPIFNWSDFMRQLRDVEGALTQAETVRDFTDIASMAKVAEALAREGNLGVTAQNRAVEYRVRAYAGAADVIDRMPIGKGIKSPRPGTLPPTSTLQKWRDARTAHRHGWQHTLDPDAETSFAMYVAEGARLRSGITPEQGDDWYTPPWIFDQLGLTFDLDVAAATDEAQRTCPARGYYTEADDGLAQPWAGLIWCNPPYSNPAPWITRWADHDDGLILVHFSVAARRMPILWAAAHGIRFFAGMHFIRPNGEIAKPYWGIQLAARGVDARLALRNISNEWASPAWEPAP